MRILIWFNPQISTEELSCLKVMKQVDVKSGILSTFPQTSRSFSLYLSIGMLLCFMTHGATILNMGVIMTLIAFLLLVYIPEYKLSCNELAEQNFSLFFLSD